MSRVVNIPTLSGLNHNESADILYIRSANDETCVFDGSVVGECSLNTKDVIWGKDRKLENEKRDYSDRISASRGRYIVFTKFLSNGLVNYWQTMNLSGKYNNISWKIMFYIIL